MTVEPDPFESTVVDPPSTVDRGEDELGVQSTAHADAGRLFGDELLASPEVRQAKSEAHRKLFGAPGEPVRIDRFLVLQRLGGGGMGVVYAAYDPQLDRKVAIKLLRPSVAGADPQALQARLVREAQAMAKVSHPNVITVHEVGTFEGRVFVAMEFLDGLTLREWSSAHKRSWRDIRHVFLAVGRGLSAAHAVGLVHRDFKPDNVMIVAGQDKAHESRILVLDFGLAKLVKDAPPSPVREHPEREATSEEESPAAMTQTGALMGTPAYMAPEQHDSPVVDARADQFSFCVALFEAVYARRPFEGRTYAELALAVKNGKVDVPSERGEMPLRAHRAMLRGLRPDPAERFESMEALLAELAYDPAAKRWRTMAGSAAVMLVALGGFGVYQLLTEDDPVCDAARAKLARAWSPALAQRGARAFAASDKPYGADAWTTVEASIDTYVEAWGQAHHDVCTPQADPEARVPRILCLEWQLQEVEALSRLFADADGEIVERAVEAVANLPDPNTCVLETGLRMGARLPDDPQLRARVVDQRARLAHAKGLGEAGKYAEAIDHAQAVLDSDTVAVYRPLAADAYLRLGRTLRATGQMRAAADALRDALYAALAAEHDRAALDAAIELVWIDGYERADFDGALAWMRMAEALVERSRSDADAQRMDMALGAMFETAGRHKEARAYFEDAVRLGRRTQTEGGRSLIEPLSWLASSHATSGELDVAKSHLEEALAIARDVYGDEHPAVARVHVRLGQLAWKRGRYEVAAQHFADAQAIDEKARGPEHPAIAPALTGLAFTAWARGQPDRARELGARIEALDRVGRVDDEAMVGALEVLGHVEAEAGHFRLADSALDRALAVARRRGPEHPLHAFVLYAKAEVARRQQRYDDALRYLDQSRALLNRAVGPLDPRRLELAVETGRILVDRGDTHRAADVLDKAIASLQSCCRGHFRLPDAKAALEQAKQAPSRSTASQ